MTISPVSLSLFFWPLTAMRFLYCKAINNNKVLLAYLYQYILHITCIIAYYFHTQAAINLPPPSSIPFSERFFDCQGGASVYSRPLWFRGPLSLSKSCREQVCALYTTPYTPLWIYRHVEWSHATLISSNTAVTWVSAWITMLQCDMVQSQNEL